MTFSSKTSWYNGIFVGQFLDCIFLIDLQASYDREEPKYEQNSDPFIQAAVTGDVLADQTEGPNPSSQNPQFSVWR